MIADSHIFEIQQPHACINWHFIRWKKNLAREYKLSFHEFVLNLEQERPSAKGMKSSFSSLFISCVVYFKKQLGKTSELEFDLLIIYA